MGNQYNGSGKRHFKRIAIPADDAILGIISAGHKTADTSIAVKIINLGAGGLHFFLRRGSFKEIRTGDHLILWEIKGTKNLDFISNVELEVKWIAEHQSLKHVGIGCEFLNISDQLQQQIDQFVNAMRMSECKNINM